MATEPQKVQQNLRQLLVVVRNLESKVKTYLGDLKTHYKAYLTAIKNNTTNPAGGADGAGANVMPNYSFKEVDSMYTKLTKTLYKISQHVAEDHTDIIAIGNAVISLYGEQQIFKNNIDITKQLPNSMEKFQELAKLNSKYQKAVMKYNKLAATFNEYSMKFHAMDTYLKEGIIVHSSSSTGKQYSVSINQIVNWFKDLSENDGVSQLRGEIIQKLITSYASDQSNPTPVHLTPISLMDTAIPMETN